MKYFIQFSKWLAANASLFIIAIAVVTFFVPDLFVWVRGTTQTVILGIIMLTMGLTLTTDDFRILARRPLDILIGACAQFFIMPCVAYLLVHVFRLEPALALGILLVGCCPGGVSSNIMSYLCHGDVAFSVGMTCASTLLAPVMTPMLMELTAGQIIEIDAVGMFLNILIVTIIPVGIGCFLNYTYSKNKHFPTIQSLMPGLSVTCLACIVGGVISTVHDDLIARGLMLFLWTFAVVFCHNTLGYILGYTAGRIAGFNTAKKRTISIEVGMQNAGLATVLAGNFFASQPLAVLPCAISCAWHSISGTILAGLFLRMKKSLYIIIGIVAILYSCGDGKSVRQLPNLGNTPYQPDTILVAYATNPERALTLLDSALLLGNVSDYRAQFIRAKIYSKSLAEQRLDSAISICKQLLNHDSVRHQPAEQVNILDMLIACSRARPDYEQYLQWATQKAGICQKQGKETERWRTEADIGLIMTQLGQVDNGIEKIDEAIRHLDSPGSIDRMDAFVVACKRKINALDALHRYTEVIPLGQRILDRLDHYELHANDYAEDSYRLSWSDNPVDRDRYLDFSRAQAWGFMAHAYAYLDSLENARKYLDLFDGTAYSKSFAARRFIAPTQLELGNYDEALATYAEIERRMAADTINDDYAVILRARAIASRAKGHTAEALDYQTRYANLSKVLSDSLHRSEAHNYAARYHAQEQQLEIQEKQAEAQRSHIISIVVAAIALLAIAFALYFFRQKCIITAKNRALVRMINNNAPPEETPKESSDEFTNIDHTIRTEHLYKDFNLQRQDICDRFGINRHTLNDMLTQHADGLSFPQYINTIRLEESLHLLHNEPSLTISAIAKAVGFSPSNFREQFKQKYGITPQEYRQNM